LSTRRKRNYWPRLTECLLVAALIYVFAVGVTTLLHGSSLHLMESRSTASSPRLGHTSSLKSDASDAGKHAHAKLRGNRSQGFASKEGDAPASPAPLKSTARLVAGFGRSKHPLRPNRPLPPMEDD